MPSIIGANLECEELLGVHEEVLDHIGLERVRDDVVRENEVDARVVRVVA